jgi:hypothetical protein
VHVKITLYFNLPVEVAGVFPKECEMCIKNLRQLCELMGSKLNYIKLKDMIRCVIFIWMLFGLQVLFQSNQQRQYWGKNQKSPDHQCRINFLLCVVDHAFLFNTINVVLIFFSSRVLACSDLYSI